MHTNPAVVDMRSVVDESKIQRPKHLVLVVSPTISSAATMDLARYLRIFLFLLLSRSCDAGPIVLLIGQIAARVGPMLVSLLS